MLFSAGAERVVPGYIGGACHDDCEEVFFLGQSDEEECEAEEGYEGVECGRGVVCWSGFHFPFISTYMHRPQ